MKCGECKYWLAFSKAPLEYGSENTGFCCRYPPQYVSGDPEWPVTQHDDWCGEFKVKE